MKRLRKGIFLFFFIVWTAFPLYGCAPMEQKKDVGESATSEAGTEGVPEETALRSG